VKPPRIRTSAQLSSPTPWFIAAGIALVVALGITAFTARFVSRSVVVAGTITGLIESSGDNGATFAPEYSFTTQEGRAYQGLSNSGSNPPKYSVGQAIRVRYDPAAPSHNRIESFGNLWGFPLSAFFFSLFFAALGFVMRAAKRRKSQAAAASA
jgi:Protein of unknown function (DUF3592)